MKKIRLDQLLFDKGLSPSRERAKTTIMSGLVFVDGQRADKPGVQVSPECALEVRGDAIPYVSRGGLKLEKALRVFNHDPAGQICIDCGASTGGFTDVLLQNGALKVFSVDVGYGQLAWRLRTDPRVISMERTNIRYVTKEKIPDELDLAVMDLSFISLALVLSPVRSLLKDDGRVICLIKPQFEAGRESVGKKGVVRDKAVHRRVLEKFVEDAKNAGFALLSLSHSPVKGPEGNIEYLGYLSADEAEQSAQTIDVEAVVAASHLELDNENQG